MQPEQFRELYNLIKDAFIVMQNLVNTSEENHKWIFPQHEFPRLNEYHNNGMPRLSTYYPTDGPKDYTTLFTSHGDKYYYYEDIPSFKKILDFFTSHIDDFKEYPYYSDLDKDKPSVSYRLFHVVLLEAFDCYMHETNSNDFDENAFKSVLHRLYDRIFKTSLPVSICVPMLLVRFEDEETIVTESIRIRKLTENETISSYRVGGYSDPYELFVVSSATHIFELQYYALENGPILSGYAWEITEAYPVDIIDKWFAAFRIVTHYNTGYGQIMCFPDGWGIRNGNLIEIHGVKIRKFPYAFIKERKDIDPTPLVTSSQLKEVIELFKSLNKNKAKSLSIAIKRLNMAYLREEEEDLIIDIMIGIEALITRDDCNEITHKVSTRTAFILSTLPQYPYSIIETFTIMKKLYAFRSKVVHGADITDKQRIIGLREDVAIPSVDLAKTILELLILAMANHPEYLDASKIDFLFMEQYESLLKSQGDEKIKK